MGPMSTVNSVRLVRGRVLACKHDAMDLILELRIEARIEGLVAPRAAASAPFPRGGLSPRASAVTAGSSEVLISASRAFEAITFFEIKTFRRSRRSIAQIFIVGIIPVATGSLIGRCCLLQSFRGEAPSHSWLTPRGREGALTLRTHFAGIARAPSSIISFLRLSLVQLSVISSQHCRSQFLAFSLF